MFTKGAGFNILPLIFLFFNLIHSSPFKWTVAFYMAGDNNLAAALDEDLEEIRLARINPDINIVIFADRGPLSLVPGTYIYIKRDTFLLETVKLGNLDSGSPSTLAFFIRYVLSNYPSDRFGLVFWGHGTGWTKEISVFRSLAYDATSGNSLEISSGAFRASIPDSIFDFIVFDACLMGSIEVLWELEGKARYVLASPALVPSSGLNYRSFLSNLSECSSCTFDFLSKTCDDFCREYENQGRSVIISLYDLSKIPDARRGITLLVVRSYTENDETIKKCRISSITYNMFSPDVWDTMANLVDLGDFAVLFGNSELPIVAYSRGTGIYGNHKGVSVFFPLSFTVVKNNFSRYGMLRFQRDTNFLDVILNGLKKDLYFEEDTVRTGITKSREFLLVRFDPILKASNWLLELVISGRNADKVFSKYSVLPIFKLKLPPNKYEIGLYICDSRGMRIAEVPVKPNKIVINETETKYYENIVTYNELGPNSFDVLGRKSNKSKKGYLFKENKRYLVY